MDPLNNFYTREVASIFSGETPTRQFGVLGPPNPPPPPREKRSVFEDFMLTIWFQKTSREIKFPPNWEWRTERIYQVRKHSVHSLCCVLPFEISNFLQKSEFLLCLKAAWGFISVDSKIYGSGSGSRIKIRAKVAWIRVRSQDPGRKGPDPDPCFLHFTSLTWNLLP